MQLEAKHSAASQPFLRPDLAAIGFDDRAGDRQSEAGALRLGCKERVENSLQLVGWNAGTGIENRYLDVSVPGQHGFQRQSSRAWIAARHASIPFSARFKMSCCKFTPLGRTGKPAWS